MTGRYRYAGATDESTECGGLMRSEKVLSCRGESVARGNRVSRKSCTPSISVTAVATRSIHHQLHFVHYTIHGPLRRLSASNFGASLTSILASPSLGPSGR